MVSENKKLGFLAIIFDLGGVLVELIGVPRMLEWTGGMDGVDRDNAEDELWRRWLLSPAVRLFERGRSTPEEFAGSMIVEFSLPVDEGQFLREFISWPKRLYPGATDLLRELASSYKLASLSNNNELHWERFVKEMGLDNLFHFNFPSHKTRLIKPDAEAFHHAVESMGYQPEQILFFDDNQMNIDSAISVGMAGYKVSGVDGVKAKLREIGILR